MNTERIRGWFWLCCAVLVLVPASAFCQENETDRLSPSNTFYVDFPELGRSTFAGDPVRMGVFLPADYTPDREFPLLVWFGTEYGSDDPARAARITEATGFICVAVPYENPTGENGGWKRPDWDFYEVMLDELEEIVPNIDPEKRVAGGFSVGGYAIMALIAHSDGRFQDYFYAFMPGGRGYPMGGMNSLKGQPMFAFIGEADDKGIRGYQEIERQGNEARIDLTMLYMPGVGHSFPSKYYGDMREWMVKKVVRRDLPEDVALMKQLMGRKQWNEALPYVRKVLASSDPGMTEHSAARNALEKLEAEAEKLARKYMEGQGTLKQVQEFVRVWDGYEFTVPVKEKCNGVGEKQLAKLLKREPVQAADLKRFLESWEGFGVYYDAIPPLDKIARKKLNEIMNTGAEATRGSRLARFVEEWTPTPSAEEARETLEGMAEEQLDEIKKIASDSLRKSRLRSFIRTYGDTDAGREGKAMLQKMEGKEPSTGLRRSSKPTRKLGESR